MKNLNLKHEIYNYAFTVNRAVWGPSHLKAIKKKLKKCDTSALFIIECNLWSFYSKSSKLNSFPEENAPPNSIVFPNIHPNFEYFSGGYDFPNLHLIIPSDGKENSYVNELGRMVITKKFDSTLIDQNIKTKMKTYANKFNSVIKDERRFKYLSETIAELSKYGEVFLVRMPVANEMLVLEEELAPKFDERMKAISNGRYINLKYLSNTYITTDGNHIQNKYVDSVTCIIADSVNIQLKR
ncbi:hypothetical protein [Marivirga lumbricoides]